MKNPTVLPRDPSTSLLFVQDDFGIFLFLFLSLFVLTEKIQRKRKRKITR